MESLVAAVAEHAEWLIAFSAVTLTVGIVLVPAMVVRLPADYFLHDRRQAARASTRHPLVGVLLTGGKNLLGALFLVVGFVLLFLPGQGLLTLMVGLMIMNYPGKFGFERWLVTRPHVLQALNWLRLRRGRDPLVAPSLTPHERKPTL